MGDKFDINTLFRMVIPGYLFFLVLYSLRPDLLEINYEINAVLLTLLGLPIGFILQSIQRFIFYVFPIERRLTQKDRKYIIEHRGILRVEEKRLENFLKKDNFYYAANIDYLLHTEKDLEPINKHLRFLYTRWHSSAAAAVSIFLAILLCFVKPCSFSTIVSNSLKLAFLVFWILLLPCLIYVGTETGTRILWWRRLIVDINYTKIKENITKSRPHST